MGNEGKQEKQELTTDLRLISIAYAKHLSIVCQADGQLTATFSCTPKPLCSKISDLILVTC